MFMDFQSNKEYLVNLHFEFLSFLVDCVIKPCLLNISPYLLPLVQDCCHHTWSYKYHTSFVCGMRKSQNKIVEQLNYIKNIFLKKRALDCSPDSLSQGLNVNHKI